MGVYRRKNKLWISFTYKGRQCREPLGLHANKTGLEEAKLIHTRIKKQIKDGTFAYKIWFPKSENLIRFGLKRESEDSVEVQSPVYLFDILDRWHDQCRKRLKITSVNQYEKDVKKLKNILPNKDMRTIRTYELREFLDSLISDGYAPKTISNMLLPLRGAFAYAYERELIDVNNMDRIKNPPIGRPEIDVFNKEEVKKILIHIKKHYPEIYPFFEVIFMTGMRVGEVLAMSWSDLNLEEGWYYVRQTMADGKPDIPKTPESKRYVLLPDELVKTLAWYEKKYKKNDHFVFTNQYGKPYVSTFHIGKRVWRPTLKKLGIRHRIIYQGRHTFATLALQSTTDINFVARQLGHSSHQMIYKTYGRIISLINGEKNEMDKFIFA
ncbi:MAG: tyrosine-type recombinase/integrase [Flexistipes sinusarabici]|uniref:Tyrosine-type recombinase/integrase n=1 Tax=Flexistipes sinusarabici TaxID=2352 RepID=A0A5D0MFC8_FLESI|nr:site-specific integrase [Flexistipes sinusarabici]TYB32367.1 MAG: tyrosine-type recombinase/integrase [Flexistipes sinusarabici]